MKMINKTQIDSAEKVLVTAQSHGRYNVIVYMKDGSFINGCVNVQDLPVNLKIL